MKKGRPPAKGCPQMGGNSPASPENLKNAANSPASSKRPDSYKKNCAGGVERAFERRTKKKGPPPENRARETEAPRTKQ